MMFSKTGPMVKTGLVAAALAAATLAFSAPAAAHGRHRGGNDAAIAIGAGVIGLAIGAAVASNNNDIGYYPGDYYAQGYVPAYPPYPVYNGGYYGPAYAGWNAVPAYPVYRGYDWRFDQARRWREQRRWERRRGWRGW